MCFRNHLHHYSCFCSCFALNMGIKRFRWASVYRHTHTLFVPFAHSLCSLSSSQTDSHFATSIAIGWLLFRIFIVSYHINLSILLTPLYGKMTSFVCLSFLKPVFLCVCVLLLRIVCMIWCMFFVLYYKLNGFVIKNKPLLLVSIEKFTSLWLPGYHLANITGFRDAFFVCEGGGLPLAIVA